MVFDDDILRKSGYNKFTLFFNNKELERRFWEGYVNQSKSLLRKGLVAGFVLISIFASLEINLEYTHESRYTLFYAYASYFSFVPLIFIVYGLSYTRNYHKYSEILLTIAILTEGTITNFSHYISRGIFYVPTQHGLIMIFVYSFFIVRMRYLVTLSLCTFIFAEYLLVVYLKHAEMASVFLGSITIFLCLLLNAIAGYINEIILRKNYLLMSRVSQENEKRVTENEALEREVKRRTVDLVLTNQALKKAMQKAESTDILKSTILANISHEIRTPLTRIVGFAELLAKGEIPEDKKRQYSEIIEQNSNQLLGIVTNMMELSKIQSENFPLQNVTFLLHDLLDDLHPFFANSCDKLTKTDMLQFNINKDNSHRDKLITTDLDKLKKVLRNLLHNAIKFTPRGEVTVSYTFKDDNVIEFCVTDNGIGIDDDSIDIIFDSFRQEDEGNARQYGGTGVGLSISKGLVTRMGGEMWVKSKKGEGSSFYFTIPLKGK